MNILRLLGGVGYRVMVGERGRREGGGVK